MYGNEEEEVTCSKRTDLSLFLKEQSYNYYEVNVTITSDELFYKCNSIVIPIVKDYVLLKYDYLYKYQLVGKLICYSMYL